MLFKLLRSGFHLQGRAVQQHRNYLLTVRGLFLELLCLFLLISIDRPPMIPVDALSHFIVTRFFIKESLFHVIINRQ